MESNIPATPKPEPVLIRTKLVRPPVRADIVERPRLLERLDEARDCRVTLVSAPAGFGKTTLAVQWLNRRGLTSAWVALDEGDSDPERFLQYVVAAVEDVSSQGLPQVRALLAAPIPPPFDHVVEVLVAELVQLTSPLILVLEDYHAVHSGHVRHLVERLVPAMPASLHLFVLTRLDPPWPVGNWRARGWLAELRARDLRFSREEVRQFFAASRRCALSETAVDLLHDRTEGWVAALRLVELSLQGAPDHEELALTFTGSDRSVTEYLVAEVFARQPPEIQEFLATTALLPRFCASLCDHVLAGRSPKPRPREIIAELERANLFLVPLDQEGRWYRYHHLFQTLILHHRGDAEDHLEIRRRAAEWFAREGMIEEALRHWIAAGDLDAAADLLGERLGALIDGDVSRRTLASLLGLFPAGAEHGRLPLLVAHGFASGARWSLHRLGTVMGEVDDLLSGARGRLDERQTVLQAALDTYRAEWLYWSGNVREGVRIADGVLDTLPRGEWAFARAVASLYSGVGRALCGEQREGLRVLERAATEFSADHEWSAIVPLLGRALIHLYAAYMDGLDTIVRRMEAAHAARPTQRYWLGWTRWLRGAATYELNELDVAEAAFQEVATMRYQVTSRHHQDALIGLCLVAHARGDEVGSRQRAEEIRALAVETGDSEAARVADSLDTRLALAAGGRRTGLSVPPPPPDFMWFWLEVPSLTYADALLRDRDSGDGEAALGYIEKALERVDAHGNLRQSIPFNLLRAEALADQGEQEAALAALAETVRLAEPLGLVRTFLDRGPRLMGLLETLGRREGRRGYLDRLLSAPARGVERGAPIADTANMLTNRELDVLELMAERLSNKEIAVRLNVSPETVKMHARNLYRKLEVGGRREAVLKAVAERLIRSPKAPR